MHPVSIRRGDPRLGLMMSFAAVPGAKGFYVCPLRDEQKHCGIGGVRQNAEAAETSRFFHQPRPIEKGLPHLLLQSVEHSKS